MKITILDLWLAELEEIGCEVKSVSDHAQVQVRITIPDKCMSEDDLDRVFSLIIDSFNSQEEK